MPHPQTVKPTQAQIDALVVGQNAPVLGGVPLGTTTQEEQQRKAMQEMAAMRELQILHAAITQPWRQTMHINFAVNILHGPNGYKLLQAGLPDGTRLDFELDPAKVASLLQQLQATPEPADEGRPVRDDDAVAR